jgi:ATP-binding cassette, subfamily B, bacterial
VTDRAYGTVTMYLRVLREARDEWPGLGTLLGLSVATSMLALLMPFPIKIAVDSAIGSDRLSGPLGQLVPNGMSSQSAALVIAGLLLVFVALASQVVEFATLMVSTGAGERLLLGFRARLFSHAQRLSIAYHDEHGASDSSYRIQYDAPALRDIAVDGLIPFLTAAFTVGGMIYVTASIDALLALIALGIVPILLLILQGSRRRLRGQWMEAKRLDSSAFSVVQEALTSLRVVKAFGTEERERDRFVNQATDGLAAKLGVARAEGVFGLLVGATLGIGSALVLVVGVRRVQRGELTLGELLVVMTYLTQLYQPLRTISKKAGDMQSTLASAERVFTLLDRAPDPPETHSARRIARARGDVRFDRVCFRYGDGKPILLDTTFHLRPGESVGIRGATGAGKTTLISLLVRFYDPTAGHVLLDDVELADYRLSDLRNQFTIVLQEPVLFSTTIEENIAYARPGASHRDIVQAARAADAHLFIKRLSGGYDARVGERGMRLSGGERQRIAIARAYLKDAPVLVLDEPTSSVDHVTEASIVDSLKRLSAGRTTLVIAHRPATLARCERQLELVNGRLVERSALMPPPTEAVR